MEGDIVKMEVKTFFVCYEEDFLFKIKMSKDTVEKTISMVSTSIRVWNN